MELLCRKYHCNSINAARFPNKNGNMNARNKLKNEETTKNQPRVIGMVLEVA
jgi:hypothetical protein